MRERRHVMDGEHVTEEEDVFHAPRGVERTCECCRRRDGP